LEPGAPVSDGVTARGSALDGLLRLPWRRIAPVAFAIAACAWFLWRVRSILPPFGIALFLAALLDPVVTRMSRGGAPRGRAVAAIFGLALVVLALAGALILPPAVNQAADLGANISVYAQNFAASADKLTVRADAWYEQRRESLTTLGMTDPPSVYVRKQTGPISTAVRGFLDAVRVAVTGMLGQVLWLVIIPLSLFYFLLDYPALRARVSGFVPAHRRRDVDRMIQDVVETFGAYVRGLTKVCLLYGSTATVLFWILRVKYALFLGIAAGVFYAVPYVGPGLAVVSVAVICLTTGKTLGFTLLTVIFFVVMHVAFDYGVTPRVVGGSVGLHPLLNIFALMCGVALFGVWGMILAVPVAASLKRVLVYLYPRLGAPPDLGEAPETAPATIT
jgi:predicted PurR-regulated permease PerM